MALTDEAIEKIKAMILSGTLRAGDRLPKEADLAAVEELVANDLEFHRRISACSGNSVLC